MCVYSDNSRISSFVSCYMEATLQSLNAPSLLMLVNQEAKEIKSGDWGVVIQEQVQAYVAYMRMNAQSKFLSDDYYYDMENMPQQ